MTPTQAIESQILIVRGHRVILAADLAALYGVETRRLNEQVRRNIDRFPIDFLFQLTRHEFEELRSQAAVGPDGRVLRSQIAALKRSRHAKYPPFAFTEHGAGDQARCGSPAGSETRAERSSKRLCR